MNRTSWESSRRPSQWRAACCASIIRCKAWRQSDLKDSMKRCRFSLHLSAVSASSLTRIGLLSQSSTHLGSSWSPGSSVCDDCREGVLVPAFTAEAGEDLPWKAPAETELRRLVGGFAELTTSLQPCSSGTRECNPPAATINHWWSRWIVWCSLRSEWTATHDYE